GGPASGWRIELSPGQYRLGRPWSQAQHQPDYRAIPDAAISRHHIAVTVGPDLAIALAENPEATNRLLIDGEPIEGAVTVQPGQEIRLGDSVLTFATVEDRPPVRVDQLGQVPFHRTPLRPARPEEVELPPLSK